MSPRARVVRAGRKLLSVETTSNLNLQLTRWQLLPAAPEHRVDFQISTSSLSYTLWKSSARNAEIARPGNRQFELLTTRVVAGVCQLKVGCASLSHTLEQLIAIGGVHCPRQKIDLPLEWSLALHKLIPRSPTERARLTPLLRIPDSHARSLNNLVPKLTEHAPRIIFLVI